MDMNYKYFWLIIIFLILFPKFSEANDSFSPWDFTKDQEKRGLSVKEASLPTEILKNSVLFFSKYISPVDGDRCPMYPTCAAYSMEAIEKHGFVFGILMTVDRLIHEGNEMDSAPKIKVYDKLRYLDPVVNNDFWWQ